MDYSDDFYSVEELLPDKRDTVYHVIKRKEDDVYLDLHITGTAHHLVGLNGKIEKFMSEQIEYGKKFIELMNDSYEIIIKSSDVENNSFKPLTEMELKTIIENR